MRLRSLLLSLVAFFVTAQSSAAIKSVSYSRKAAATAERYEILDIKFRASGKIENPFETQFDATFKSADGTEQRIPAFYNGGNEWVVRFTPSASGVWSYTTESEISSLNKKSGSVKVSESSYRGRKGMIKADPKDPRHLVWEDGTPYFLMGFECDFLFALDYHNENTNRLDKFVGKIADNGFNHVVMNVYANDVVWVKDPALLPEYEVGDDERIFPFLGSNSSPDHSALNVEFFKRLDRTMEALNDRDVVSHLMIYVWNKNVAWPEVGSADDDRYFDYVVKRYQGFTNLVWDISKEAILYGTIDDNYVNRRITRLREMDGYKRMVTVHDIGYCNRNSKMVDMASHQNWKLTLNADMNANYKRYSTKPVLNVEHGGYEECDYAVFCGNYINAEVCLRRNYECIFGGTYTTYYWQGCSWNVLIDDYDTSSKVSYRPKMEYFKYMVDLFTNYPYHTFSPAPDLSNSGFCLSNGEGTYLMYMPKESYKTSTGKIMKTAKRMSFQWFNVTTGEYTKVRECSEMNIFANEPHPWHMKSDAVLIIKVLESKEEVRDTKKIINPNNPDIL